MDRSLDQTTLETIALLESRLHRLERLLYGPAAPPSQPPKKSVLRSLADLERRFAHLIRHYRAHPSLFQPSSSTPTKEPPTQLSPDAVLQTVLSYASSFPATASALTAATSDETIPDAAQSAALAALVPRMRATETTQLAQAAEIAELRKRSEVVLKAWYTGCVLRHGEKVAELEKRLEGVEVGIRRAKRVKDLEEKV
ncbi:uncharacterized protein CTHT_0010570 [Thermochaetoides thermophila DSM 1495]|uniref:Nuclear distribution protein n=1 Tax=Chaetomium thermophilum (strain DSM 1495 / CBS 144.50 / IMI 039719) TaxID=759272 RepID=G0S0M7_CHATD|nr:hypothetical protein CTHT_0010570 [Thermochaetoides thermophila DSM 1495]EGS22587.1 hypothetical protein CTHT_0010570 [Thermochaetoides thermophila DSM 1495]